MDVEDAGLEARSRPPGRVQAFFISDISGLLDIRFALHRGDGRLSPSSRTGRGRSGLRRGSHC
jgi:hypothetical protein